MVDYVTSGQSNEVPEELASEAYQTQVPSFWRTLGAEALSGYRGIEEQEQRLQTDPNNPRNQQPGPDGQIGRWSPSMGGPIPATSQFTNQKDLQKQYSDVVQQQLAEHQKRDSVISRYQEAHSWPVNFAVGTAGFLLDPLNAGAMFMPGLGEETIGAALAKIGLKETLFARVATHVAAGITSGVAYQAPLSALKAGLSDPAVQEYGWRDALRDIAMQGAANGVFHGLWGVGKDIVRGKPSVESNQETSIEPVRSHETEQTPQLQSQADAFNSLADQQRGEPERLMVRAQMAGSKLDAEKDVPNMNAWTYLMEHTGDLTHRMSELWGENGPRINNLEAVSEKVSRVLRYLNNPKDMELFSKLPELPEAEAYSKAHEQLPVYNELQRAARDAAVKLGRQDFVGAKQELEIIKQSIDDETYTQKASEYNPNFEQKETEPAYSPEDTTKLVEQEEQVYLQNKYGIRTPVDPSEVAEGQKDLYQNGYAQGTPSQDLKTVKEDMEASKVNKTASQQPITTTPGETKPSTAEVDNQALEAKWKEVSDQKQPIVEWKYASGETHTETFEDTALRQAEQKELDDTQKMMDEIKPRESGYAQAKNCLLEAGI